MFGDVDANGVADTSPDPESFRRAFQLDLLRFASSFSMTSLSTYINTKLIELFDEHAEIKADIEKLESPTEAESISQQLNSLVTAMDYISDKLQEKSRGQAAEKKSTVNWTL
eukprot:Platyproteum_vivax@DN9244_c0_g1_i1.p1